MKKNMQMRRLRNAARLFIQATDQAAESMRRYSVGVTLRGMDPDNPDVVEQFMNWWRTTTYEFDDALGLAKTMYNLEYKWPWDK